MTFLSTLPTKSTISRKILPSVLVLAISAPLFGYAATSSTTIEQRASFIMKSIELKEKRDNLQGSDAIAYYQTLRQIYAGVLSKIEAKIAGGSTSSTPVTPTPPATTVSVSPDGTTIPSATQIVDANRSVWTVTNGVISKDGRLAGYSNAVTKLVYKNGLIYQQNTAGNWWSWNGTTWVSTSNPLGTSTPTPVNPTPVVTAKTYKVRVMEPVGGMIMGPNGLSCPGNCTLTVNSGDRVTLSYMANNGFTFSGWGSACTGSTGATCTLTFNSSQDLWASASFRANSVTSSGVTPPNTTGGNIMVGLGLNPVGMTYVDISKIPAPSVGYPDVRLQYTGELGSPLLTAGDVGSFRSVCDYSHMNFDDPIVYPGQQGKSHLHVFFGNTSTNYLSTVETLPTVGNSTCRGGIINRSAYWTPAMIDSRTGAPIRPDVMHIYYKSGYQGVSGPQIKSPPKGLRIIAGDPGNTVAGEWWSHHGFFVCMNANIYSATIPNCPAGDVLEFRIKFPQCWNGKDLDSPDHKSHMAYGGAGGCPATHPYPIPEIQINQRYNIPSDGSASWRLSSDHDGVGAGLSAHADWMNGWSGATPGEYIPDIFVRELLNKNLDGHSHLIGDGRAIY